MANMVEDLECLCHMMKTVGRRLDHDKAKVSHCVCVCVTTTCACAKSVLSVDRTPWFTCIFSQNGGGPVFVCLFAQAWVDQYFERIRCVMNTPGLQSRIKFMLQDVVELRQNNVSSRCCCRTSSSCVRTT